MNRREALTAMATLPMVIQGSVPEPPIVNPTRIFYLDWLRYSVVDGVATTEARIRHRTGWLETKLRGNTIELAPGVRLVVNPGMLTLESDGEAVDLILGQSWSMAYMLNDRNFEYHDGKHS